VPFPISLSGSVAVPGATVEQVTLRLEDALDRYGANFALTWIRFPRFVHRAASRPAEVPATR
jgi:hypothetical protein